MTPKLEKLRDELAVDSIDKELSPSGDMDFKSGFTACHDTLMPVIEELMGALQEVRDFIFAQEVPYGGMSKSKKALTSAREMLGIE